MLPCGRECATGTLDAANSGHGPGLSLAWDSRGRPLAALDTPVAVFHRLFSGESQSLEERQALLAAQQNVLDAVRTDATRVRKGLSSADADKLDEYFQSIRDIEVRLTKEKVWLTLLQGSGVKIERHGDSTGPLDSMRA